MIRKGETTLTEALIGLAVAVILLLGVAALYHRSQKSHWVEDPTKQTTKTIKAKLQVVEQRENFDWRDSNAWRTRAETVFYVFSTDGYKLEVHDHTFIDAKEGDSITSSRWVHP